MRPRAPRPGQGLQHISLSLSRARPRGPSELWPSFHPEMSVFLPRFLPATSLQRLQCPLRNHFPSATTWQRGGADPHSAEPCSNPCDPYTRDPASTAPPTPCPSSCNQAAPRTERDLFTSCCLRHLICLLPRGRQKKHTLDYQDVAPLCPSDPLGRMQFWRPRRGRRAVLTLGGGE